MNGYESSPSTPQKKKKNTTGRTEDKEHLCVFFTELPKYISRHGAEEGTDRQAGITESIGSEWFIVILTGYAMPTQPWSTNHWN